MQDSYLREKNTIMQMWGLNNMYIEILAIGVILFAIMISTGAINLNKFVIDNEALFRKIKESDWDFLVKARYGNNASPDVLYNKRVKEWLIISLLLIVVFLFTGITIVKIVISFAVGYGAFKLKYLDLKSYYKRHVQIIDAMLPHYLKNIEILIQHYTVPVAIGKSMEEAPEIFKDGLQDLIDAINSGDGSINPYMDFAKKYPVRDSMRMMRLLYRLSLGRQENKQEQLVAFSKSISSLQQKARETKYKLRLEKMEGMTMKMLITTGIGVMILLILAVLQMIDI